MANQYQSSFSFDAFNSCTQGQPAGMKLYLAQQLLNDAATMLSLEDRTVERAFRSIVGNEIVSQDVSLDIEQLVELITAFYQERKADAKAKEEIRNKNKMTS